MAAASTDQMPDQVDVIIADFDLFTSGEIIKLALDVDANLRGAPPIGTPVDLGWASANWVPSVGAPAIMDADQRDPSPAEVTARAKVAAQGTNEVLSWRPSDGAIFVTNNVPYIGALNAGHSPQSPRGFVQDAIEKAVREANSAGANKAARSRRASAARAAKPRPRR